MKNSNQRMEMIKQCSKGKMVSLQIIKIACTIANSDIKHIIVSQNLNLCIFN